MDDPVIGEVPQWPGRSNGHRHDRAACAVEEGCYTRSANTEKGASAVKRGCRWSRHSDRTKPVRSLRAQTSASRGRRSRISGADVGQHLSGTMQGRRQHKAVGLDYLAELSLRPAMAASGPGPIEQNSRTRGSSVRISPPRFVM